MGPDLKAILSTQTTCSPRAVEPPFVSGATKDYQFALCQASVVQSPVHGVPDTKPFLRSLNMWCRSHVRDSKASCDHEDRQQSQDIYYKTDSVLNILEHSAINSHTLCVGLAFSLQECKDCRCREVREPAQSRSAAGGKLNLGPPWCPRVSGTHCHFLCVCKVNVNQISPFKKKCPCTCLQKRLKSYTPILIIFLKDLAFYFTHISILPMVCMCTT